MNDFFRQLQADREIDVQFWRKHPELRKQLVDDAYPDEAHFVYELLQNAEDAGAETVEFELFESNLVLKHDGTRLFSVEDVEAITDVSKTGKGDGRETIGRFGIGFKSVFKYTESPQIFSGEFSFEIVDFVCPKLIQPRTDQNNKTTFIFPFNSVKKPAPDAWKEIKAGLEQLSNTTLLFLKKLQCVRWVVNDSDGSVMRLEHSDSHIEILKQISGQDVVSSHWLRFTAPVGGMALQRVAVAFELAFKGEYKSFNGDLPIAEQLKITPAKRGKVAVFFPAEKETSNLRFHLHAPFIPELSRASIKDSSENTPLYEQLANLVATCLHKIKGLNLLSGDFLAVLPNEKDGLPKRYQGIRTSVIKEMTEHALVPTRAGGFSSVQCLLQAKSAMKDLLSDDDLAFLYNRQDNLTWAISANQIGSPQDRFLDSLGIPLLEVHGIVEYFKKTVDARQKIDDRVVNWLSSKSDDWHQALYAMFYDNYKDKDEYGPLCNAKVVRLAGGGYAIGKNSYFATGPIDSNDPFPRVSENVLAVGTRQAQQANAKHFLEKIGVREPGETEALTLILKQRYAEESGVPSDDIYLADLQRFMDYAEKNPNDRNLFAGKFIFKPKSDVYDWASAESIYLDLPFKNTHLSAYHSALSGNMENKLPLADWYESCKIDLKKFVTFAESVGCCSKFFEFSLQVKCKNNLNYPYLRNAPGTLPTSTHVDVDYALSDSVLGLLERKGQEFSRLIWVTMCGLDERRLSARFRWNESNAYRHECSQLVQKLRAFEWVPLKNGSFVTPRQATRGALLEGFTIDAGYKWLDAVEFAFDERTRSTESQVRAAERAKVGIKSEEELRQALAFLNLPEEKRKQILDASQGNDQSDRDEFPEKPVRNQDLRADRVREQAEQTPEKQSLMRLRSVDEGYPQVKAEAQQYLRDQYTTASGVMFCQVCKAELPFKLPTGAYFFEKQQIADGLDKRHYQLHLALCPNHAAMFRFANDQKDEILDLIANSAGREIELVLGGNPETVQFTEMHLADIKACIAADGL